MISLLKDNQSSRGSLLQKVLIKIVFSSNSKDPAWLRFTDLLHYLRFLVCLAELGVHYLSDMSVVKISHYVLHW
ncbi:hypothetical protein NC651_011188 [Populus alba x Populus x berolinensis]|nr:hypothetical protein NC651_011188 [Populus alba x Populus x berolinensis]